MKTKNGAPKQASKEDFVIENNILVEYKGNSETVIVPDGVTCIGNGVFLSSKYGYLDGYPPCKICSITIPASVTRIGEGAFRNCYRLREVYNFSALRIEKGSDENGCVGYYAYDVYTSKDEVSKLSTDDKGLIIHTNGNEKEVIAYVGTDTDVIIPDFVSRIGEYAFLECINLTSVTIGNSVTSIGEYAFSECSSLTSITIPDSVRKIESCAFVNCYCLREVYNFSPLRITKRSSSNGYVGYYAYDVYTSKDDVSKLSTDDNGFVIHANGDEKTLIAYVGTDTNITIPDGVTSIGEKTFFCFIGLTSIVIPDSVTKIADQVFRFCTRLSSVSIGNSVTSIGKFAFFACNSLTSITITNSLESIGDCAFSECSNLRSVIMGNRVTSIGDEAFSYCDSLKEITIPDSVTHIGERAFSACSSLTSIRFLGTKKQWNAVKKGYDWDFDIGSYTITCTDGTINE